MKMFTPILHRLDVGGHFAKDVMQAVRRDELKAELMDFL